MSQKASPTLIGVFVVCGVVLAIGAVVVFGGGDVFKKKVPCVMFFDGNINGLTVGSKVKIRGVPVGEVVGIDMPVRAPDGNPRIPVYAKLTQAETYTPPELLVTRETVQRAIEAGLRARLESESFVTGIQYVDLDFRKEEPEVLIGIGPQEFLEIPTLPPRLGEVIQKLLATASELDFKGVVDSIKNVAQSLDDLLHSPRIDEGFNAVNQTLTNYRELAKTLDTNAKTLSQEIDATLKTARSALGQAETTMKSGEATFSEVNAFARDLRHDSKDLVEAVKGAVTSTTEVEKHLSSTLAAVQVVLDPEAPLIQQLHDTLAELGRASRSLALLADELQRNPSAVVRGRDTERK